VVAPVADEVSDDGIAAAEAFFLYYIEQHQRSTPVSLGTVYIGFQCQQQSGFKRRQLAGGFCPLVPGNGLIRRLKPFLDGVARQTCASLNLTDRQMLTEKHPADLCIYDHGNHPLFTPA
jgi:hypothetical protein